MAEKKVNPVKVLAVENMDAEIARLVNDGVIAENTPALIAEGIVKASLAVVKVDGGKFTGDYVKFGIGEKATEEADIQRAMLAISGGNLTAPLAEGDDTEEGELNDKAPSVVKYFLYGADLHQRARTQQKVRSAAEGPEKALERLAASFMKAKPKLTKEQALAMAKLFMEEEADETSEETGEESAAE